MSDTILAEIQGMELKELLAIVLASNNSFVQIELDRREKFNKLVYLLLNLNVDTQDYQAHKN